MAKLKTKFVCTNCGAEFPKWVGKCTECDEWNSVEETEIVEKKPGKGLASGLNRKPSHQLNQIVGSEKDRIQTGINEFNRVMGGGIVKDSVTIVTAKPGAGKSTLLLQVADDIASQGFKVLYASGEESESQIKNRADRLFKTINPNIWALSDNSMDNVIETITSMDADLVIIDSIQTFTLEDYATSRAGSPLQTMECANALVRIAKNSERQRAVIIVGQMNKSEELAGLRALEHLVDTVLIIDGEDEEELRGLSVSKNRFGSTWERGFFFMTEAGMVSIDNPSLFFMTKREKGEDVSGSALSVIKDGSRPIIAEIESLVSKTFMPYPSRISECLRREQINTLISILEQKGNVQLYDKDVVLKATGGLKFKEHAVNLAVMMSIVSSVYNTPISNDVVFIADVGLTGELKKVPSLEVRVKEADRMGFKTAYVAKGSLNKTTGFSNIKIIENNSLHEVINHCFKRQK